MAEGNTVTVRLFGDLCRLQLERGRTPETTVEVPAEGITGHDLAVELELPVERIEGIFCNHTIRGLAHVIHPGDEVAFVPYGTPGPHRFYLGLYEAGQGDE
jgi:molybdopterin converting factor small subunit